MGYTEESDIRKSIIQSVNNIKGLHLGKITVNEDYRKEWNIYETDFLLLCKDGVPLRNTLYRTGWSTPDLTRDKYFLLLKHVEAYYDKNILEMCKNTDPKHLESRWVIIDWLGNEKVEFKPFDSPYLVKDSVIYTCNNRFYNIETGELYCESFHSFKSKEFLFLNNEYDKDESKRGVLKIHKGLGTFELFQS